MTAMKSNWFTLLDKALEGRLSKDDAVAFSDSLKGNPQAIQDYIGQMRVHQMIAECPENLCCVPIRQPDSARLLSRRWLVWAAGLAISLAGGLAYAYYARSRLAVPVAPTEIKPIEPLASNESSMTAVTAAVVPTAQPAVPDKPIQSNALVVPAERAAPVSAVVTSSAAAVTAAPIQATEGEETMKLQKKTVAAVAATLALTPPTAQVLLAVRATDGASGDLAVSFIETRDGDETDVYSANSTIDTLTPHGTIYSFH